LSNMSNITVKIVNASGQIVHLTNVNFVVGGELSISLADLRQEFILLCSRTLTKELCTVTSRYKRCKNRFAHSDEKSSLRVRSIRNGNNDK
jgi:hypothetical protein